MLYQVVIPKRIEKKLNKLDYKHRLRIINALESLGRDPYIGKKLEGEYQGVWSCRVWPYRIIYEIKKFELVVLIINIGHRQGVYK